MLLIPIIDTISRSNPPKLRDQPFGLVVETGRKSCKEQKFAQSSQEIKNSLHARKIKENILEREKIQRLIKNKKTAQKLFFYCPPPNTYTQTKIKYNFLMYYYLVLLTLTNSHDSSVCSDEVSNALYPPLRRKQPLSNKTNPFRKKNHPCKKKQFSFQN